MANNLAIFSTFLLISMITAMPYTGSDYNPGGYNQVGSYGNPSSYGAARYGYGAGYGGGMKNLGTTNKGYGYGGVSNSYGDPTSYAVGGGYGGGSTNKHQEDELKNHDLETETLNINPNIDHLSKVTDTETSDVTHGTDHTLNLDVVNNQLETNDQKTVADNTAADNTAADNTAADNTATVGNDEKLVPESSISNSEPLIITGTVDHVPGIPESYLGVNINSNHEVDQKLEVNEFDHKVNSDIGINSNIGHEFGIGTSNFQAPLLETNNHHPESFNFFGNSGQLYTVTEASDLEDTADTMNTANTADTENTADNQNNQDSVNNQFEAPQTSVNNLETIGATNTVDHSLDTSSHTFTPSINTNHETEHNIVTNQFEASNLNKDVNTNIVQETENKELNEEKDQLKSSTNIGSDTAEHLSEEKIVDSNKPILTHPQSGSHGHEWNTPQTGGYGHRLNIPQNGGYGHPLNIPQGGGYGHGFNAPHSGGYGHGFSNPPMYPSHQQFSHGPGHFNPHGHYHNPPPPYYPEYYPPPMQYQQPMYPHHRQSERIYEHNHNHGHVHSAGCGHTGY